MWIKADNVIITETTGDELHEAIGRKRVLPELPALIVGEQSKLRPCILSYAGSLRSNASFLCIITQRLGHPGGNPAGTQAGATRHPEDTFSKKRLQTEYGRRAP